MNEVFNFNFFQKYIVLRIVLSEDKYRVLTQFKEK